MRRALVTALAAFAAVPATVAAQVTSPPPLAAAPALTMPTVRRFALPNGLKVQVVERHEVPLVQAVLVVTGGARLDGDRPGLASFTGGMLDEGAAGRDAFALANELEYLGAMLSSGASWDAVSVDASAPTRTFPKTRGLMADVVLRPTFASTDVRRQRDLRLAGLLQARDQPEAVAGLVFGRVVYPATHPYHRSLIGDSASTASLDSAVVRDFWARAADPKRATLYLVGDITPATARKLAAGAFGKWKSPAKPLPLAPASAVPAAPRPATHVVLVDKPGAAQSVITIGAPGVERTDPDYHAITLLNTLLGGSFSARLNDILREQRGYTYGARSSFSWRPVPGPFTAGASVRTDVTDSSLAIFFREFERVRTEPVPEAELERARQYLVLGALGEFEMNAQVAGALTGVDLFGLPLSSIPADLEAMKRLGAADVQRAAGKHLDPRHLTVVVVGDVAKIRPGIEALGLGPIEVRDVDGKPVP
ncbi:MAG TPA: pitrilysin family protein [Gemmatimonadales bacterium]|nr:pitrilysin family protein [Gemmatimonadales bacterium]